MSLCKMRWRWCLYTILILFHLISNLGNGRADRNVPSVYGQADRNVLLEFKKSVSDPSGLLSSWDSKNSDYCSWFGVSCDTISRVLAINITGGDAAGGNFCAQLAQVPFYGFGIRKSCGNSGRLVGRLLPTIGKLNELKILSLPFNGFSGEIPVEILGLEKLEVLDLEGNFVSGSLPGDLGRLRRLRVVNLGFNEIVGGIPDSLGGCGGLEVLNLAGNLLNGSIPEGLGRLEKLRGVYLSVNRLSGLIPVELGEKCGSLEYVDLSGNLLVGGIPRSLGNCSKLRSLLLFSNMLEDVIPSELGRLEWLEVLDVSRNTLSGTIPSELGGCIQLSVLVLSNPYNPLESVGDLKGASSLGSTSANDDDFNYYEGGIPEEVASLPNLKILWVPRATLEGPIPNSWGTCESLEMINLADNFLTEGIPEAFGRCKNLHFLNLSSNRLAGELPPVIPVPCMSVFDVSANLLSGSIPTFNHSICPSLPTLNAYNDYFTDPFSAYSSYFTYKTRGILFPSYVEARSLAVFHSFGGNNFSGPLPYLPIPSQGSGKVVVYAFLAGGNKLTGSFPGNLFEKCDVVGGIILNVSNNQIYGSVPMGIGKMCRYLKDLDVSGNRISGSVPDSFADTDSLISLDMSQNELQGQIPACLGRLKGLKYLSFARNNLTGDIPASFGKLYSLEVLQLSSNSLSGVIPKDLVNLRNLSVLLLNNNRLTGHIPSGLVNVTTLSALNLSFNNLSGPLPSNEKLINCSSILGNPLFPRFSCLSSLSVPSSNIPGSSGDSQRYAASPSESTAQRRENTGFNSIEIASITSASAIVSVLLALVVLFLYTRKCMPRSRVGGSERRREVTVFTDIGVPLTFENVVHGTGSFNASNCIGSGGFGATYKAEISPGVLVAIKRLSVGRFQGIQQFHAEIRTLGRVRHQNLVTLIGYHASETEMFLIYNYLPGGNLEKFIQERPERAVDWRILHKIAIDVARALAYLHDQCVPRILHRDVKPSNILLDNEYNAYLSDFGLARLLGTSETHATTGVAGTFGYVAPEYAMTCRVSDKADVYSYGVVLLELISDKQALDPSFSSFGNGFNIVGWACMLLRQGKAKEFFTAGLWDAGPHNNLVETLHLAVMCTVDSLSIRPTMKQVVQRLKQLQPPPC